MDEDENKETEDNQAGEEKVELTPEEIKAEAEKVKEEAKTKARNRLSDRNKELTYNWRETERKLDTANKQIEELTKSNEIKEEPDPDDYTDPVKLADDQKKYKSQTETEVRADERKKVNAENAATKQQEKSESSAIKWRDQQKKGLAKDPDYYDSEINVQNKLKLHADTINQYAAANVRDLISDADNGAALIIYYNAHPDELEDILYLSKDAQDRAILKKDLKLEAKPVKTISTAPNPTRSEQGRSARQSDPVGSKHIHKPGESHRDRSIRLNSGR